MEFNTKTSTYKLATQKDVNKVKNTTIHKQMDNILGFEDFEDLEINGRRMTGIIRCNTGYSVVLKVSSTDSRLLSDADLESFENTLLTMTYGLNFDLKLEISNRKQNFKKYIEFLELASSKVKNTEFIENYKKSLYKEFDKLEKQKGTNMNSNYIIVYSNDFNRNVARKELFDRVNYLFGTLQDSNFKLSVLSNMELVEYLFKKFHRGLDLDLEKFIELDAFSIVADKMSGSLQGYELTIPTDFVELKVDEETKKKAEEELELRNKLSDKEYKKHLKKEKKEKAIYEKNHKKEVEEFNLLSTSYTDIIKPDVFEEKADYVTLGSANYVRCLAVTTLPSSMNIRTLGDLNTIENMEININLLKLNDSRMSKVLRAESNKIISNINLKEKDTGTIEHAQRKRAKNIEALIAAIETNADKLFASQIIIKIWSDNLLTLENLTRTIKENFSKSAMNVRVLFKDQKRAFETTLPTPKVTYKECMKNLTAGGASCLIPNGCTQLRHSEGRYIGRTLMGRTPVILDHFICQKPEQQDSDMYSNPNVYIVGKPGSGKSVFMKTQISRSMPVGDIHAIMDPHGEYKVEVDKLGGKYIYLKNGVKTGINPLELRVTYDELTHEKVVPLNEKIGQIVDLVNNFMATYRDGKGLIGTELIVVTDAIRNCYTSIGITNEVESLFEIIDGVKVPKKLPTLSDLRFEIEKKKDKVDELAEMMKLITGDGVMNLFDCETDDAIVEMLSTRLIAMSLKQLDDKTKTYAMTTILNWLWSLFSSYEYKSLQKNIEIDEAWMLAKHIQSLALLENFARSGRKYLISLVLASQSIQEFLATQEGKAILDFCSFKYIFRQDARLANEIGDYFGLSDSAKKSLPNFSKGQCIIATETGNALAQVDLFDSEKVFATTSGGNTGGNTNGQ